jgi:hypothetical protein
LIDDGTGLAAVLSIESAMGWHLTPDFTNESGLYWLLSDAGSWIGTSVVPRSTIPLVAALGARLAVVVNAPTVLSAQALVDADVENGLVSEAPLVYDYYPFYVTDPLGFVRTYIDMITSAGVIPEWLT